MHPDYLLQSAKRRRGMPEPQQLGDLRSPVRGMSTIASYFQGKTRAMTMALLMFDSVSELTAALAVA